MNMRNHKIIFKILKSQDKKNKKEIEILSVLVNLSSMFCHSNIKQFTMNSGK